MSRLAALLVVLWSASAVAGDKLALLAAKKDAPRPARVERDRWEQRLRKLVGKPPEKVVNVWHTWRHETLVLPAAVDAATFDSFLRCHFTDHGTNMDMRLLEVLAGAAKKFDAPRIEIVSGYRAPKFNLMLRKKGHEVARDSQHTYGHAVDFRLPGVPTRVLLEYVRSLHLGGAGFYPESQFVHADTGPVRYWAGQ